MIKNIEESNASIVCKLVLNHLCFSRDIHTPSNTNVGKPNVLDKVKSLITYL